MTIGKEKVFNVLDGFPAEIDLDELRYRLYLLEKIALAEEDVAAGRLIPHEEVMRQAENWGK